MIDPDMSVGAVRRRLELVSGYRESMRQRATQVEMAPEALTRRLRAASQLRLLCLRLGEMGRGPVRACAR